MTGRVVSLAAGAVVGVALSGIAVLLVLTSDHEDNKAATIALAVTAGLSFIWSGLFALWRRPENRTGYLLAAVGYLWFFGALSESDNDWLFTIGAGLGSLALGALAHLLLAFPGGRLVHRRHLWLVVATYALVLTGGIGQLLFEEFPSSACPECRSTIVVGSSERASTVIRFVANGIGLALLVALLFIVVTRFLRAQGALRRALGPVLGAGALAMLVLALQLSIDAYSEGAAQPLEYVFLATFAMVPAAFLVGVLRSRLARSGVGDLLLALARGTLIRDAIAGALADPTLEVAYWLPDEGRYVSADGGSLPDDPEGRAVTLVEHDGRPTAALVHDPALRDERELVEAVAAAAGLWLDNERLQAALRAQVEFLETIVSAAPSLLCSLDPEGRITNLNDAARRAGGYADDEDVRWRLFWEAYVAPEEREEARRRFEEAAPEHAEAAFEHTFVNGLGEEVTIAWSTAPLYDEQRSVRSIVCAGLDVTVRERQHQQLQASAERLRAAIEASPVAIVEYALDDTITRWNPAAERIFGWTAEEVVGGPAKHQPPGREEELRELFRRVRAGEVYMAVESKRVRSDGAYIDVEISAAPIRDSAGSVLSHMALFADITERKRQEEELRASRARIVHAADDARRVLERNLHDGAQQRLVALSLSLRLAQSKVMTDPAEAQTVLEGAREELASALDELRELARGIHPAVLTDRGLSAAVETLATRSPVPVEFDIPEDGLPQAVEAAAYYVIAEALANVIKYAAATRANVRVEREDGRVLVAVADDGVGGADASRGSGLNGLADRVEALGGNLTLDSPVGRGTCVTAVFPLQRSA
ncbi:MAG TPA: PAS domain S-box protein [Gaiellaceae bacterium]|nr:PAS domain S-box protein [Gaiellaceae bacterium]